MLLRVIVGSAQVKSILSFFICAGSCKAKLLTIEKAAFIGLCIKNPSPPPPPPSCASGHVCVCSDSGLQQSVRLCIDLAH